MTDDLEETNDLLAIIDCLLDLDQTLFQFSPDWTEQIEDKPFNAVRYVRRKMSKAFDKQLLERQATEKRKTI